MAEFEINGITYKSTKLPLIPAIDLLLDVGPLAVGFKENPVAALSAIPREKIHDIIAICLGSCERKMAGGTGWAKIWNRQANLPMFDDIGLMETGTIVMQVLTDNFADFLPGQS
jgi:hypothetical protein